MHLIDLHRRGALFTPVIGDVPTERSYRRWEPGLWVATDDGAYWAWRDGGGGLAGHGGPSPRLRLSVAGSTMVELHGPWWASAASLARHDVAAIDCLDEWGMPVLMSVARLDGLLPYRVRVVGGDWGLGARWAVVAA